MKEKVIEYLVERRDKTMKSIVEYEDCLNVGLKLLDNHMFTHEQISTLKTRLTLFNQQLHEINNCIAWLEGL